jgi:hypothetical protein
VENQPFPGGDKLFNEVARMYGAPAYVRRARGVQEGLDSLVARCRRQREEWLPMVRLRLGLLQALAGDWERLRPLLKDPDQLADLQALHATLEPRLRVPVKPASSSYTLLRGLRELRESIERFNRRWLEFLPSVDLSHVNKLREGYNRYFVLEKECALRSARLSRHDFRPLPPFTLADLTALLPPLPVPQLKE